MIAALPRHAPLVAFVVGTLAYLLGAAPGATWMDSGELGVAGYHLGVAHPPGHPAYVMLAKLASFIPIGEIGFRIALLSAVSMGAALAGVVAIGRVLIPRAGVAVAIASLLLALSPAVRFNAERIEVYAPVMALLAWALWAALTFCQRRDAPMRHALACALAMALAAAIHPLIAAAAALPMAVAILAASRGRWPALVGASLGVGALGLLSYAFVIARANASDVPLLLWGDPSTLGAAWDLVTGESYRGNFELSALGSRAAAALVVASEGTARSLVLGGFAGLLLGLATRLRGAGLVAGVCACVIGAAATQSHFNPDLRAYLLPAVLCLALGTAILAAALGRLLASQGGELFRFAAQSLGIIALGLFGFCGGPGADEPALGDPDDLARYFDETVARMPPGPGVYFANGDAELFMAMYERDIGGGRPDIALANAELARTEWFLRRTKRAVPDLFVPFVDDGQRGMVLERLAIGNMRLSHPVGSSTAAFGELKASNSRPLGRGFELRLSPVDATEAEAVTAPLPFSGTVGRKVARRAAHERAIYEAERGRLTASARAAGFAEPWIAALGPARPERPELFSQLPLPASIFIHEDSLDRLLIANLLWRSGERPICEATESGPLGACARDDTRALLAAWQRLWTADRWDEGQALLATMSLREDEATTRMLTSLGAAALAEKHLRALLARRGELSGSLALLASLLSNRGDPAQLAEAEALFERSIAIDGDNDESHARLGVVRARQGNMEGARASWRRALELNPQRRDVAGWLRQSPPGP